MATQREKERAHGLVNAAIDKGELIRQPCEICGATKTDAHHDDYAKPLDVRWLCRRHHRLLHSPGRTQSLTVRASLTADEYRELRILALDRGQRLSQLVADTLRDALLKGAKP